MSPVRHVNPDGLFGDTGYHYGALVAGGSVLFSAGACPIDSDGVVPSPADFAAQAHLMVDNLEAVLTEAGASFGDLVRTTLYVVGDADRLSQVWDVVSARLAPHTPPSTLLGVAALGYPNQLVELDGIAALPAAPAAS